MTLHLHDCPVERWEMAAQVAQEFARECPYDPERTGPSTAVDYTMTWSAWSDDGRATASVYWTRTGHVSLWWSEER